MSQQESEEKPHIPTHKLRLATADKQAQLKAIEKKNKQLRSDFGFTFGSPEGQRALKHILKLCGFGESCIGGNTQIGMDVFAGTLHNNARLNVYLELRKFIPVDILKKVEFPTVDDEIY